MASPIYEQTLRRKLVYTALILVLFTGAWVWRHYSVDEQAVALGVREQSRGEVELSGALLRLILTGSRGFATAALWLDAQNAQRRNEWNMLELRVRQVAKLQPHFVTPWLFQSWNLSYNVSVEADRVSDKYFYITRGIQLLAQGERQNRNDPDMRWYIGFYTQHKIGQSDETNTLRSLFQLSCVPPNERDPARFWATGARRQLNMDQFRDFCEKHPQLIRRLKEGMRRELKQDQERQFYCHTPEAVVKFLTDNAGVPSLYQDIDLAAVGTWQKKEDVKKPEDDRFPVLPPATRDPNKDPRPRPLDDKALTVNTTLEDRDDAAQVARAWFSYALEPIPDPDDFLPGITKPVEDRAKWRQNRYMTTVIFRSYPGQAQRMTCERLQEEGWYDESGWEIPDWFQGRGAAQNAPVVGQGIRWSLEAWREAHRLWDKHGQDNHLMFKSAADERNYYDAATRFSKRFGVGVGANPPPSIRPDDLSEEDRVGYNAARYLFEYNYARNVSNFAHFHTRTRVEGTEPAVKARKLFFDAETLRLAGSPPLPVLAKYEHPDALKGWRNNVLLLGTEDKERKDPNKDFRRDSFIQEQTFEIQHRYLRLVGSVNAVPLSREVVALAMRPAAPALAGPTPVGLLGALAWVGPDKKATWQSALVGGPFDGDDKEGVPLITPNVRRVVMERLYPGFGKTAAPPQVPRPLTTPAGRPGQGPAQRQPGGAGAGK
jgi:hypothetical protein